MKIAPTLLAPALLAAAALLSLSLPGCAHVAAPRLESRTAAARDPIFARTLHEFQRRALQPQHIDTAAMVAAGIEELARTVPDLRAEPGDGGVVLSLRERTARIAQGDTGQPGTANLDAVAAALDATVAWVAADAQAPALPELQAAALRGAVRSADRWSTVVTGGAREGLMGRFQGTMSGIGCRLGRRDGNAIVLDVVPGAPAAVAGLQPGDRIVAVDDAEVSDLPIAALVSRLQGAESSPVRVAVERGSERLRYDLVRRRIALSTVNSKMLARDVGYLQVTHIAQNTGFQAQKLIGGIRESEPLRGLVLDLRGNSGGSMIAAGAIADQFLAGGVLIESRNGAGQPVPGLMHRIEATVDAEDLRPSGALVILVDKGTGSSAELLAAALSRHDRAVIIGQRTYGKGVLQQTVALNADLLLKVTVARSYAAGEAIPDDGLLPDVTLDPQAQGADTRCSSDGWERPGPVATWGTAGGAENADPAIAAALRLIDSYPGGSRQDVRRAVFLDSCTDTTKAGG